MAPTFELLKVAAGDCDVLEDPVIVAEGVKEADALVVVSMAEPVDKTLVAVDSGASTAK